MDKTTKDLFILALLTLISIFLIWLPHILSIPNFWGLNFSKGFSTIYQNFDGLEYIVIAKSFYDSQIIASLPTGLSTQYFASHFPGYSILIAVFAPILGFLKSMLFVSIISTIFAVWMFYFLVRDFKLSSHPLFLSTIFLVLPARWLIVHSVGSSEPTFILLIITAIYFLMKFEQSGKFSYLMFASLSSAAAQLTRPPGILLGIGLLVYIVWRSYKMRSLLFPIKFYPLLIIPLTLLAVFFWYFITYQDFFAYFKSGDNIHLTFPPFQVFNKDQFWVGDIWLEDVIYIFIISLLGGVLLLKQRLYPIAFFVLTYVTASTLISHRDISRYLLPTAPFLLIAFEKVLTSREFKLILPIIIIAIYLYSQNFIIENVAPVANLNLFN